MLSAVTLSFMAKTKSNFHTIRNVKTKNSVKSNLGNSNLENSKTYRAQGFKKELGILYLVNL